MNKQFVNEAQLLEQLSKWNAMGRSLISLPKFDKHGDKITMSVVSIDNMTTFIFDQSFYSYTSLLTWYGTLLDKIDKR
ncbi:MAG: hypothetical protein CML21_00380 [Rheinheimera sp.]|nr:hypothetical protein [Rheinheimera sp.]|tara:strand:- start:2280 stop:2513 length:234 start_codon:yes stop_codon:yes gene_type:complete